MEDAEAERTGIEADERCRGLRENGTGGNTMNLWNSGCILKIEGFLEECI